MQVSSVNSDSIYIGDYTNLLTYKVVFCFTRKCFPCWVNPTENVSSTINYRPNINVRIGLPGSGSGLGWVCRSIIRSTKLIRLPMAKQATLISASMPSAGRWPENILCRTSRDSSILSPKRLSGPHYLIPTCRSFPLDWMPNWIKFEKVFYPGSIHPE